MWASGPGPDPSPPLASLPRPLPESLPAPHASFARLRIPLLMSITFCMSFAGRTVLRDRFLDRLIINRDEDALVNSKCPKNLELRWQTEVSSSIYATPLIADINRLEESVGNEERIRRVYRRAIANVLPTKEKRYWQPLFVRLKVATTPKHSIVLVA